MSRTTFRTVISYDITSDKRRRQVVKILEGLGYRVQYSVFECELSERQLKHLKTALKPYVKPKTNDSIRFYILCGECQKRVESLGNDLSKTLGGLLIV